MNSLTSTNKPTLPPPRVYTPLESVFAWICYVAGYLFCRVFPVNENPLGGFLFVLCLFVATTVVFAVKGTKLRPIPMVLAVSAVVVAASLIISANGLLRFFAYLYALVVYGYYVYASAGATAQTRLSDLIVMDFIKALFVMPFRSIDALFRGMFSGKAKNGGKFLLKLVVGVLIAALLTAAAIALLSYDRDFMDLIRRMFDFNFGDVFSHIVSLCFAVPIGMYLFGIFISSTDRKGEDYLNPEIYQEKLQKLRVAPTLTVLASVLPLLFIYVVFFISQWKYYVSGFTGVLPEGFSYAQYAREGFFQLCILSFINLTVILAVVLLMRRTAKCAFVILKATTVVFSLFTLLLISTAVAKMVMYIDCYGLTHKRVYATWLMGVLAIVFLLISVGMFVRRWHTVVLSLGVCVILFAALSLSGVDGLIAEYNVDRYIDGTLESVDMEAMMDLGDAAVPSLVKLSDYLMEQFLADEKEQTLRNELNEYLREKKAKCFTSEEERSMFSYDLPYLRARKALKTFHN